LRLETHPTSTVLLASLLMLMTIMLLFVLQGD